MDGCNPFGSVLQDEAGSLYGTTYGCGSNNKGIIWKVSQTGKETILHNFAGSPSDGCNPYAGVLRDSKGNLYGITTECGANRKHGALYELSASGKLSLLHSFTNGSYGELLRSANGALFGTTIIGGPHNAGTVWKYVP